MDEPIDETLPDVVKAFLRKGARLESIRLDATGRWTHEGLDFENSRIIELFNRSIGRTEGGTWVLEIGPFTYPIEVEDTSVFVEQLQLDADPPQVRLSDGTTERLDLDSLSYGEGGRLYCRVRDGGRRARFKRAPYYLLADFIAESGDGWVLRLDGREHPIALAD